MSARTPSKRFFGLVSCVSIAGAVATFSQGALAACPDPAPATSTYKGPPPAACTAADITAFEDEMQNPANKSIQDLATAFKAAHATCAACVFTNAADPTAGLIVLDGDKAIYNSSPCYERGPGGSTTCASTLSSYDACLYATCGTCADDTAAKACVKTVSEDTNSCGKHDYAKACPNLDALDQICYGIPQDVAGWRAVVEAGCGASSNPGGSDAGTDGGSSGGNSSGGNSSGGNSSGGNSSGGNSSGGSSGTEPDDESSSGSSGGKKKPSSSGEATPSEPVTTTTSGCAQGPEGPGSGGSIASALVVGAAVIAAASRRRRKQ